MKEALRVLEDKVRRLSLSEQELEKATSSHSTDLVRYLSKRTHIVDSQVVLVLLVFAPFVYNLSLVAAVHVRFTQRNILRVYPKGTRVTSSNYNPHLGWMHGAQMVAFNMQVHSLFFPFPQIEVGMNQNF